MRVQTFFEVLIAAHLSRFVDHPAKERGGIMLVADPANLKTTLIKSLEVFPDCKVFSDINVTTLVGLKAAMVSGRLNTLGFTELQKLYQRRDSTAINIEGHLKLMVEEGFSHASFENQMMQVPTARCLVLGALTQTLLSEKFTEWHEQGFLRRFLWCHFHLLDPYCLMTAMERRERIDLEYGLPNRIEFPRLPIPYTVTEQQSRALRGMLVKQHAPENQLTTPFAMLQKIYCVLNWRWGDPATAWDYMVDFAECLDASEWARVQIDPVPETSAKNPKLITGPMVLMNGMVPVVLNVGGRGRPRGKGTKKTKAAVEAIFGSEKNKGVN